MFKRIFAIVHMIFYDQVCLISLIHMTGHTCILHFTSYQDDDGYTSIIIGCEMEPL